MARFGVGALILLATSCAAVPPPPLPPKAVTPACTFGDFRSCAAQCERGSAESCNNTGAHYEMGAGVTRDLDLAARYYARACGEGAAAACENEGRARAAKLEASVVAPQIEPPAPAPPTPSAVAPDPKVPTYGTFASTGGMLGTWNTTAGHCYSGANQIGGDTMSWANFEESSHGSEYSLRIGAEAGKVDSVAIQRARPYRSVDVSREQCSRFDAKLRTQSDGSMAADLEIECSMPDGGKVTASIHDAACGDG
jgi:TPR repeat protein